MKRFGNKTLYFLLCVLLCFCTVLPFAACGPVNYTVTFDGNYTGAPAADTQTVPENGKASRPSTDPTRDGYYFTGWYTDAAATEEYDFGSEVTADLTLYAGWLAMVTVTFDYNYPAAAPVVAKVAKGGTVTAPDAPKRDGFLFSGWYSDAECTVAYDFSAAVELNTTLYAKWLDASVEYAVVTFDLNYAGAPTPNTEYVEVGQAVAMPATGDRTTKISGVDGNNSYSYDYAAAKLLGWYTDAAGTEKYEFSAPVDADLTLYAKWQTRYTFEAELTDLTDKQGYGYSLGVNDEELIKTDTEFRNQGASFGYSVGYLYDTGLSVDYIIYSDRAVDNVTFVARLSSEYRDIYIAPSRTTVGGITYQSFAFNVNGVGLEYSPIALTGAMGQITANQRPFDDWTISTKVSLKEGRNDINLVVTNSDMFESTIYAAAPMIDCIYLTSESELTWEPKWSNMGKIKQVED